MKKMRMRINLVLSAAVLAAWALSGTGARAADPAGLAQAAAGGQAAAKGPQWKTREEYDAYQAMAKETDPHKKITAAEGVITKYPNSDFKDIAYVQEVGAYQQLGQSDQAIGAAKKALTANPDNLDALTYLCFAAPFMYNAKAPGADAHLTDTDTYAKHGLEVLAKLQKPAQVSDSQFSDYVKAKRAIFNNAVGFVALQKKDYPSSITALKAAIEDNPTDSLTFSLLGQDYLYSTPPDYDNAIWNLARSVALAQAGNSPNATALQKFYDQVYTSRHGSNAGEADIVTQAKGSATPPADFKVAGAPKHTPTGNAFIDAFYNYEDNLKAGGDTETQTWSQIKGQQFGGPGYVDSVDKQPDGTFLVHVDITNESKNSNAYDIELKDSQAGCKDLQKGDPVRFQGTISAYTTTPSFVLTLDSANINDEDLASAADSHKPKATPRHHTTHAASSSQ
jgi:tetratricopeptide (TPR) repeat protein